MRKYYNVQCNAWYVIRMSFVNRIIECIHRIAYIWERWATTNINNNNNNNTRAESVRLRSWTTGEAVQVNCFSLVQFRFVFATTTISMNNISDHISQILLVRPLLLLLLLLVFVRKHMRWSTPHRQCWRRNITWNKTWLVMNLTLPVQFGVISNCITHRHGGVLTTTINTINRHTSSDSFCVAWLLYTTYTMHTSNSQTCRCTPRVMSERCFAPSGSRFVLAGIIIIFLYSHNKSTRMNSRMDREHDIR